VLALLDVAILLPLPPRSIDTFAIQHCTDRPNWWDYWFCIAKTWFYLVEPRDPFAMHIPTKAKATAHN